MTCETHPKTIRMQASIKEMKFLILKKSLPTPRLMGSKLGMSSALDMEKLTKSWSHMDKASSHTSNSIVAYLAKKGSETGIKCILFDEIPVKSPDASQMILSGYG
ncbi:hypothetical protein TNCV_331521 [Trichonephila clavipes]|nr:hypothetical protein TNCV_331521 [Trichonephila clavipes]